MKMIVNEVTEDSSVWVFRFFWEFGFFLASWWEFTLYNSKLTYG